LSCDKKFSVNHHKKVEERETVRILWAVPSAKRQWQIFYRNST